MSPTASSTYAAAGAAIIVLGCARLLGAEHVPVAILLTFVAALLSYTIDRVIDPGTGAKTEPRNMVVAGVAFAAVALFVAATGHIAAALHSLLFPAAVVAYARPWVAINMGPRVVRRVKDIPLVKPIYVGFMWAQLGVSAALFAPSPSIRTLLAVFAWLFVKSVINAAACDLMDVDDDRARGVASWPVLLGRERTVVVLQALNVVGAAPLLYAVCAGMLPRSLGFFEVVSLYNAICLVIVAKDSSVSRSFGKAFFDMGTPLLLLVNVLLSIPPHLP